MSNLTRKQRLQKIINLLKFVLTLDDKEVLDSSIQSIIDLLEEEISK